MDKRTILAVALSFFVLLAYNSLVVKPNISPKKSQNYSQVFVNKVDISNKENISTQSSPVMIQPRTAVDSSKNSPLNLPEAIKVIENNDVRIETSNIGGVIKSLTIKKYSHQLPITAIASLAGYEDKIFYLSEFTEQSVKYLYSDNQVKITKQYDITQGNGLVDIRLDINNISNMSNLNNVQIESFTIDTSNLDEKITPVADRSLFEYSASNNGVTFRKGNAFSFSKKEDSEKIGNIKWVGFRDKYFYLVVAPRSFKSTGYSVKYLNDKRLQIGLQSEQEKIDAGQQVSYNFSLLFGSQDFMKNDSKNPERTEIITFSNISALDFVSKSILRIMVFVHKIIPSWGICIIFISILVYSIMYPLTLTGMRSMKRMQLIQPRMAQLREQYKNQPQKLNKAVMELYKEHGVNPLGGCLPFILQMPIFIGLYQALWRTIYLKGQSFLWIKDLSQPDRLFTLPTSLPIIGNEFNILPLIMAFVMFLQQKASSKNMTITDPTQLSQQKMMLILMPVMMGFVFYKFASGLTMYFTMFYTFSTITQYKMSKVTSK